MRIGKLFNLDTRVTDIEGSIEAFGKTFELANLVQDPKFSGLSPHLNNIASVLKPLSDSREAELAIGFAEAILSSVKITAILHEYYKTLNDPKTFAECVVLVCFQAYLESLKGYVQNAQIPKSLREAPSVLKDISNYEVTDESAEDALTAFPTSDLAKVFRGIGIVKLQSMGFYSDEAKLLVERSIWHTDTNIPKFWNDLPESIRRHPNASIFELGKRGRGSLNSYLKKLDSLDEEHLILETGRSHIKLRTLYVSLEVKEKKWEESDEKINDKKPIDIHEWVKANIISVEQKNKLIVIEGTSGQGKTAFCKTFIREVKNELYPAYIPVYVKLQEVNNHFSGIEESINKYLNTISYFKKNKEWLTDDDKRFIIILDGIDELPLSNVDTTRFLEDVLKFQEETHNQFLITGRTGLIEAFQDTLHNRSIFRGVIQPMSTRIQLNWIKRWAKASTFASTNKDALLLHFDKIESFFVASQTKASENLLSLILLKALHEIELAARERLKIETREGGTSVIDGTFIREILNDLKHKQIFKEVESYLFSSLEEISIKINTSLNLNINLNLSTFLEYLIFFVANRTDEGLSLHDQFTISANREEICYDILNAILPEKVRKEVETKFKGDLIKLLDKPLSDIQKHVKAINDYFSKQNLTKSHLLGDVSKSLIPFLFLKIEKERKFNDFLSSSCPKDIEEELAREPLLLYLLATLHDTNLVNSERLLELQEAEVRGLIYQKTIELSIKRTDDMKSSKQFRQTYGLDNNQFRELLEALIEESAFCESQSRGQPFSLEVLRKRLELDTSSVNRVITSYVKENNDTKRVDMISKLLNTFLTKFPIRLKSKGTEKNIIFSHKSFREYLFSRIVSKQCKYWSSSSIEGDYTVETPHFEEEIHNLLGHEVLSSDVISYITTLLLQKIEQGELSPERLLTRLQNFYLDWCSGKSFDNRILWLASTKNSEIESTGQNLKQIDIHAGINTIILLLELHQYARQRNLRHLLFYPCQKSSRGSFRAEENLLRAVGYCYCMTTESYSGTTSRNFVNSVGQFLHGVELVGANLNGVDFSGANFNKANLSDVNFTRADLSGSSFVDANLAGAKLLLTNFTSVDITHADLSGADLRSSNLKGLDFGKAESFSGCKLSGANIQDVNIEGVDFSGSDLTGLRLCDLSLKETILIDANLSYCNLRDLDLSKLQLTGADLTNAELDGSSLRSANLSGVNMSGLDLRSFDLSYTQMVNTDLSKTILRGQDLTTVDLRGSRFTTADLSEANLSGVVLTEGSEDGFNDTDFSEAILNGVDLTNAELTGLQFRSVIANDANFTDADLRDTSFMDSSLRRSVLVRALLSGSDLIQTDLSFADLTGADLRDANLQGADVSFAILTSVKVNRNTEWEGVKGLDTATNPPSNLI